MDEQQYERFVKAHFAAIYAWCSGQLRDELRAAMAAQRIVLDLYRAQSASAPARAAHGR